MLGILTTLVVVLCFLQPAASEIYARSEITNTTSVFDSKQAAFGPNFRLDGNSGLLVVGHPKNGCATMDSPPNWPENPPFFVLVERGECTFEEKVMFAQQAGFEAVIVMNPQNDELTKMGGDDDGVEIPSTYVGKTTGDTLAANYTYKHKAIVTIKGSFTIPLKCYLIPFAAIVAICFLIMLLFVIVKFVRDHRQKIRNRLSRRNLKKLPTKKFKKGDEYESCAICLDDYEDGHKLRILPCKHAFHCKCIDPWLTETRRVCPLCKRRINMRGELEETPQQSSEEERAPLIPTNEAEPDWEEGEESSNTDSYISDVENGPLTAMTTSSSVTIDPVDFNPDASDDSDYDVTFRQPNLSANQQPSGSAAADQSAAPAQSTNEGPGAPDEQLLCDTEDDGQDVQLLDVKVNPT